MALYVTGDTHGEYGRFKEFDKILKNNDYLLITGDFGFVYYDNDEEKNVLNDIENRPYTVIWVDGNHENFDALKRYPNDIWKGGKIHRIRNNIFHLCRGQIFEIEGKTFFVMGGGYSLDRSNRREGISWWRDEMPGDKDFEEANKNLSLHNNTVDYVITHTAPEIIIRQYPYKNVYEEKSLNNYLQYIYESINFKKWYHGHLHDDREVSEKIRLLWHDILKIDTQ